MDTVTLVITDAQKTDEAPYTVTITNPVGSDTFTVFVTVIGMLKAILTYTV